MQCIDSKTQQRTSKVCPRELIAIPFHHIVVDLGILLSIFFAHRHVESIDDECACQRSRLARKQIGKLWLSIKPGVVCANRTDSRHVITKNLIAILHVGAA